MTRLFLDIESIPAESAQLESLKALHLKKVSEKRTDKSLDEVVSESGMSGAFGRILCICYALNDEPIQILSGDEAKMLTDFWEIAKDVDLFVGFNNFDFDLRFIWQRSVVHQIKPSIDIKFVRHTDFPIYDIMYEWSHWSGGVGSRIGLDGLAQAFGIPSSKNGGITGRTVYKAYKEGRSQEIYDYCARDVDVTRKVYNRLTFNNNE